MNIQFLRHRTPFLAANLLLGVALTTGSQTWGQQNLMGKYKGEYWEPSTELGTGYPKGQEAILEITAIQDTQVTGKYTLAYHYCRGTYAVRGTFQNDKLELTTGEGPKRDCAGQILTLQVQGDKLIGHTSAELQARPGLTLTRQ